jgi:hypothetical protein
MLVLGGLAGTMHATFIMASERPSLYILYAGMMGLPIVLGVGKSNGRPKT